MFARLSELRSVLQGLVPELLLSQKCNTVYVQMGPICSGCWFWNSWSVAAHFTCDGVNNTRNSHLWDHDNPHGTVERNYQHLFALNVWCGVTGDQLIGLYILPQRLTGDIYAKFCKQTTSTIRECSSTHTSDVLPAWRNTASFLSGRQAVSGSWIPKLMDWSLRCTELATKVTGFEPIRLPCVGLLENYGIWTQGEHKRRNTPNSQRCKKHQHRCSAS